MKMKTFIMGEVIKFSCDVDGVLNDYPLCWLRYLAEKCGILYETVSLAKENEKDYGKYKDEYRNSSYKANLPIWRVNRDALCKIITNGYTPVMVTSRPILDEKYPDLYDRTYQWLKKNGINFNQFDYKDPQAEFLERNHLISFHIDDDPAYAMKVAEKGVKVYLLRNHNWDFSCMSSSEYVNNIFIINNLDEILNYESIL